MEKCEFCGGGIQPGTGSIFVTVKGKAYHFCSNKCEKNMLKLKRKPRKTKWTAEYRKEKAIRVKSLKDAERPAEKAVKEEKAEDVKKEEKPAEKAHKKPEKEETKTDKKVKKTKTKKAKKEGSRK
ncbi:MAG: 50S ribosomal protein L24e [Candidatus Altiarchaeota archaeon]